MLKVFKASGEEALSMQFEDLLEMLGVEEQPVRIKAVKRYLQRVCGQPRFKQSLLLPDGQVLSDDDVLEGPVALQLILPLVEL